MTVAAAAHDALGYVIGGRCGAGSVQAERVIWGWVGTDRMLQIVKRGERWH